MVIEFISSNEACCTGYRTIDLYFYHTDPHCRRFFPGREGAALQLGGSLGSLIGNVIHLMKRIKDRNYVRHERCIFCLIRTPVAAAIFSLEAISIGVLYYAALVPCIFSSL